jgi:hypothetical protein
MFEADFVPKLVPEDSYSRLLDKRAQADTPAYGYANDYYLAISEVEVEIPEKPMRGMNYEKKLQRSR